MPEKTDVCAHKCRASTISNTSFVENLGHQVHIFCGEFGSSSYPVLDHRKLTTVSAESHWSLAPPQRVCFNVQIPQAHRLAGHLVQNDVFWGAVFWFLFPVRSERPMPRDQGQSMLSKCTCGSHPGVATCGRKDEPILGGHSNFGTLPAT